MSELIDLVLRALLNEGDEVLVPSPDYPLWTAAVTLNGGRAVHYPCRPENGFVPDPEEIARLITPRTRAIVVINPNNPTGAVYPRAVLEALARLAERAGLVVFSDEIYDQMTYDGAEFVPMATLVRDTLCATLSGLSKIYRACGYRVGWAVFSGPRTRSGRLSGCARAAELAAPVQQRPGAMGRADRARRNPKRARARRAGRTLVRIAPGDPDRRAAEPVPEAAAAAGRDVCIHRRRYARRCRTSTTSSLRSICSSRSTCWSRLESASTCRIALTSA